MEYKDQEEAYKAYEKLLLKRDELYKEAESYLIKYMQEFGEESVANFEAKIECIKLKKSISYCQALLNRNEVISVDDLTNYIESEMNAYNNDLYHLRGSVSEAMGAMSVEYHYVMRAKKLYRRIAKLIHPDINPVAAENPTIKELWDRVEEAYLKSSVEELTELLVIVNKVIRDMGIPTERVEIPDLYERIEVLKGVIEEIISTEPYTYSILLENPELIEEKHEEFRNELEEYKAYKAELEEMLHEILQQGGINYSWQMN